MITDKQLTATDNVALTSTGTTVSDAIDLGSGKSNIGRGVPIRARVQVDTTFTSGGSATLQVNYIQSANSDLSSPDILATGAAIPVASLPAGTVVMDQPVPDNSKRYVGFQYVIATAAMTAGKISAQLVHTTNSALYPAAV